MTTLGVGGPADELVEAPDVDALADALARADGPGRPVLVLGGGSNVVVADDGFPGTVVHITMTGLRMAGVAGGVLVSASAGEDWASLVARCVDEGLSGAECLSGIPGLVGATPVQNVGAYGQEIADVTRSVTVWDRVARQARTLSPHECEFAYRSSVFKKNDRYVVTEVSFALERSKLSQPVRYGELADRLGVPMGSRAPLELTARTVLSLRRKKGMVLDATDPDTRSAGSFFMNPVLTMAELSRLKGRAPEVPTWPAGDGAKVPAAWLVENAGFSKGFSLGSAAISSKHALALTVRPGGTAADLLALARRVRNAVDEHFGVLLEPEPLLVGAYL
jgi:UDP-N-acetylmuramate dehydrogenase